MSDQNTANRVIIVVGGASGIGRGIADELQRRGDTVAVFDRAAAEGPAPRGGHHQVDVRDGASLTQAVDAVAAEHGRVDGLVYAAGALDGYASLAEITSEVLNTVLSVNAVGALNAVKACVPHLVKQENARIVLFSSIAGRIAGAGGIAYTMSKHAVEGLVRHLAVELGPKGITVNAIAPGSITGTKIRTGINEMLSDKEKEVATNRGLGVSNAEDAAKLYPVGRLGTIDTVVPSVVHLLEPSSWFINGESLVIDGGYICR